MFIKDISSYITYLLTVVYAVHTPVFSLLTCQLDKMYTPPEF